jgi:hypothetical protein
MDSGDEPLPMMTTSTLGLDYFWTPIMAYFSAPIDKRTIDALPKPDNLIRYRHIAAMSLAKREGRATIKGEN